MPVSFLNVYEYNICLKASWFRRICDESMVIGFYKYKQEGNLMLFIISTIYYSKKQIIMVETYENDLITYKLK